LAVAGSGAAKPATTVSKLTPILAEEPPPAPSSRVAVKARAIAGQ
jgi:hypothetical protein